MIRAELPEQSYGYGAMGECEVVWFCVECTVSFALGKTQVYRHHRISVTLWLKVQSRSFAVEPKNVIPHISHADPPSDVVR